MIFDGEKTNWNKICQNNILGPFAPRHGLIGLLKEQNEHAPERLSKIINKKNEDYKSVGKAKRMSKLMKTKSILIKSELDAIKKMRIKQLELSANERIQKRLRNGIICNIYCGTRVNLFSFLDSSGKEMLRVSHRLTAIIRFWKWN